MTPHLIRRPDPMPLTLSRTNTVPELPVASHPRPPTGCSAPRAPRARSTHGFLRGKHCRERAKSAGRGPVFAASFRNPAPVRSNGCPGRSWNRRVTRSTSFVTAATSGYGCLLRSGRCGSSSPRDWMCAGRRGGGARSWPRPSRLGACARPTRSSMDRMDLFRRIELTTGAPSPAGQTGHRQISGRTSEGRRPRGASPMAGVPLQGASVETEAVPT